jgi:hypothetical protein
MDFEVKLIKDEIRDIVVTFLNSDGGLGSMNPALLSENSFILAKGKLYESVMDDLMQECTSNVQIQKLEKVDGFLRGFVISERKNRARLKINYIMAGASSNRLDEAIEMLSERYHTYFRNLADDQLFLCCRLIVRLTYMFPLLCSEEIDDSLLTYLDMLIKKEMQRTMGPTADDDDLKNLVGVGKDTVNVLKMVKKRLEAEIRTTGRNDIRLLSKLLGEESLEVGSA